MHRNLQRRLYFKKLDPSPRSDADGVAKSGDEVKIYADMIDRSGAIHARC